MNWSNVLAFVVATVLCVWLIFKGGKERKK